MNEIEKAIQEIEDMAYHPIMKKELTVKSMCVILNALRERAERSKGCEYCNNNKQLISREFPDEIFGTIDYSEWQIMVDRGHLRLGGTDDMQCLDHGEKIKINYCPMCGRRLEGNEG